MGLTASILLEDNGFLLQEDGENLSLEPLEFIVLCDLGLYSLTGKNAVVAYGRKVNADFGSYSLTGQTATISKNILLLGESGVYTVQGEQATIFLGGAPIVATTQFDVRVRSFTERRRF